MSTPAVLLLTGEQIIASLSLKQWRFPCSAIIGEVDIVDCVQCDSMSSIWAEHMAIVMRKIEGEMTPVNVPVWNWVLANPVLYDKPIENVKGALSLWEYNAI